MDAVAAGEIGGDGASTGGSAGNATGGSAGVGGMGGAATGGAQTGGVLTAGSGGGIGTGGAGTGAARTGGSGTGGTGSGGAGSTVVGALLDLDNHAMDFGSIVLGKSSVATFTLTNKGTATSGVPVITTETDHYPAGTPDPLKVVSGCGNALPANGSCALTVTVTPPELGLFQAYVRIKADPGVEHSLSIHVHGVAIGFEVAPPSSLDFGVVATGALVQHVITVTALTGLTDLQVYTSGEDISINASASTCTPTLAAGTSCVLTVDFRAITVGWKEGAVGIRVGGSMGYLAIVAFIANVSNASDLAIDPSTPQSFVAVFEETTAPIVFTVTNLSDTASGTIAATIVGDYSRDFAIRGTDCTILAPHATCTISVVCSPQMSATSAPREVIFSVTDGNTHLAVPLRAELTYPW
jgi:hypothetical protein